MGLGSINGCAFSPPIQKLSFFNLSKSIFSSIRATQFFIYSKFGPDRHFKNISSLRAVFLALRINSYDL